MFSRSELSSLPSAVKDGYRILTANCHDITLSSLYTGHEWVIVSGYSNASCRILHRHSRNYPLHNQTGILLPWTMP